MMMTEAADRMANWQQILYRRGAIFLDDVWLRLNCFAAVISPPSAFPQAHLEVAGMFSDQ